MAQSIYLSCLPFPFPFPLPLLLDYWERKGVLVAFSGMLHVPFIDFHFFFLVLFQAWSGPVTGVVSCRVLSYLIFVFKGCLFLFRRQGKTNG